VTRAAHDQVRVSQSRPPSNTPRCAKVP
jgi:hypothetical protein